MIAQHGGEASLQGPSFGDVLGPDKLRYLASGAARVRRGLRAGHIQIVGGAIVATATGFARYPTDWSVKGRRAIEPHLSSIDAILLAELIVSHVRAHLAPDQVWSVRTVELRAATAPHREVDAVPARVEIEFTGVHGEAVAACTIGTIRVNLVLQTDGPVASAVRLSRTSLEFDEEIPPIRPEVKWFTSLGPVSEDGLLLVARHRGQAPLTAGSSQLSFVDLLRLSAQQAQVLIYERDGVPRAASQTLWMRRAIFIASSDHRPIAPAFELRLQITKEATLHRSGVIWRVFDIEASGAPAMRAAASLAYQQV